MLGIVTLCRCIWFRIDFKTYSQICDKRLFISSCLCVRPSTWNASARTWQIFWKLVLECISKICWENLTIITGTLHEGTYSLLITIRSFLLTVNVSDKGCSETKTRNLYSRTFLKMCINEIIFENLTIHNKSQMKNLSLAR